MEQRAQQGFLHGRSGSGLFGPAPPYLLAMLGYAALSLTIFGDALFSFEDLVITHREGDTSLYFTRFRQFGFSELASGNLALWNPHTFGGSPFLGVMQSAMLYPLNLIFLVFPLDTAVNVSITFHHFLAGIFTYAWARNRNLSPLASFLSGSLLMFSAAYFMRAYAGHLTMINALPWTPLLFLAVDRTFEKPTLEWSLVGVFATSMQTIAGYPQSVFASALAVGIYCILRIFTAQRRVAVIAGLVPIAVLPIFICAVQLWMGIEAGGESLRGGGVEYDFAASFSLPPENLLTLVAPQLFGDYVNFPYWARWSIWDASLYFGLGGLALAVFGAIQGRRDQRRHSTLIMLALLVLCLGAYTPVFRFLFETIPGFNLFRAPSKYAFHVGLFASLLAGIGLQAIMDGKRGAKALSIMVGISGVLLMAGAVALRFDAILHDKDVIAGQAVDWMVETGETFFWGQYLETLRWEAVINASVALAIPALLCFLLVPLIWYAAGSRWWQGALAAFCIAEVFAHSLIYRENFALSDNDRPAVAALYAKDPGDYRILNLGGLDHSVRNQVMTVGGYSLWGYDPLIYRRIAEFMEFTQRHNQNVYGSLLPSPAGPWPHHFYGLDITKLPPAGPWPNIYHPLHRMLRCRYIIPPTETTPEVDAEAIIERDDYFPRFYFADRIRVVEGVEETLSAIAEPGFDLEHTVILDRTPNVSPVAGAGEASFEVLEEGTDHVTMRVDAPHATVLVMTDAFSPGWIATALPGSVQAEYSLLPANHVIRAVPLKAGSHRLRIEYLPDSYRIGRWISLGSVLVFLMLVGVSMVRLTAGAAGGRRAR